MKRLMHLTLFLTFAMTACNWTAAPQTPPVPDSVPPTESTPDTSHLTPFDVAQGTPETLHLTPCT